MVICVRQPLSCSKRAVPASACRAAADANSDVGVRVLTAGHGLPGVPHDELLVVADAAKHVLVLAVPGHILRLHTGGRSTFAWLLDLTPSRSGERAIDAAVLLHAQALQKFGYIHEYIEASPLPRSMNCESRLLPPQRPGAGGRWPLRPTSCYWQR